MKLSRIVGIAAALSLSLLGAFPLYAEVNVSKAVCATGLGVSSVHKTDSKDMMVMVAAIVDALSELQERVGHGKPYFLRRFNPYLQIDSDNSMLFVESSDFLGVGLVSLSRIDEFALSSSLRALSLFGSGTFYVTQDFVLISPLAEGLDFSFDRLKGDHYSYRLGGYYGFASFKWLDDGEIEASLCENTAIQPIPTGLIVDARGLKLKKGDVYQLIDSKSKALYRGKVLLLKNNLDWREKEAFSKVDVKEESNLGSNPKLIQADVRIGKKLLIASKEAKSTLVTVGMKKAIEDGHVAVVVPSGRPTGLIVDASAWNAHASLVPRFFSESGKELFAENVFNNKKLNLVFYASNMSDARQAHQSGVSPIIIKAIKVEGKADLILILSDHDAARLMELKSKKEVLQHITIVLPNDESIGTR